MSRAQSALIHSRRKKYALAITSSLTLIAAMLFGGVATSSADEGVESMNGVGPKTWYVDASSSVESPTCETRDSACTTIQAAINKASDGDTVQVAAGTYTEYVSINKRINLVGPYADQSPWLYGSDDVQWGEENSRAIIKGSGSPGGVVTLLNGASGSSVSGFEITISNDAGPLRGISIASGASNIQDLLIKNNYIHNTNDAGMYVASNNNKTTSNLTVQGNLFVEDVGEESNTGVNVWYSRNVMVSGNKVKGYGRGMQFDQGGNEVTIEGNVIENTALRGVQVANSIVGAEIAVIGNDFIDTNNKSGVPPQDSASIRFYNAPPLAFTSGSITVANNKLTAEAGNEGTGLSWIQTPQFLIGEFMNSTTNNGFFLSSEAVAIGTGPASSWTDQQASPSQNSIVNAELNFQGMGTSGGSKLTTASFKLPNDTTSIINSDPWIVEYQVDPAKTNQPGFWPIVTKSAAEIPSGTDVRQEFQGPNGNVDITFADVTTAGTTTVQAFTSDFPEQPVGFQLGTPPVYFGVTNTAEFTGKVTLCFTYDPQSFGGVTPTVYHFTGGVWVALPPLDRANVEDQTSDSTSQVCVQVDGFSPFALGVPLPPPPPPPPVFPPSAPLNVTGAAGNAQATVSWAAPASSGSFPVTTYEVQTSPAGPGCLVAAPALTCTVTGLTNGTAYIFRVRALNGAGWGPLSAASAPVTPVDPTPPVEMTIFITGSRGDVRGRPGVQVSGSTTGFDMGAILRPWIRFPGQTVYSQGVAMIMVDESGEFTWQRRTGKRIYISIRSSDGEVLSNRLIIRR